MTDSEWQWFQQKLSLRTVGCSGGCLGLMVVAVNVFFIGAAGMVGSDMGSVDPRLNILGTALLPSIGCIFLGAFGTIGILYVRQGAELTDLIGVAFFFPAACLFGASVAAIAKAILRS